MGVELRHSKADVPFYLQIPGEDREGFDLMRYFPQAVNFIRNSLETTNVLVHCLAGVSRSVTLVLAYLIKFEGMTFQKSYSFVKSRRDTVTTIIIIDISKPWIYFSVVKILPGSSIGKDL